MNNGKYRGRKWILTKWAMALESAVLVASVAGWFIGLEGAVGFAGVTFGALAGTVGLYFGANVVQKRGELSSSPPST